MSFISFIISQAKSCFSILIKIKLFFPPLFFFFLSSFDTSWQKYWSEERSHPGAEWNSVTLAETEARWWQLKTQVLKLSLPLFLCYCQIRRKPVSKETCATVRPGDRDPQPAILKEAGDCTPLPHPENHQLTLHSQRAGKQRGPDANPVTNQNNLSRAGSFQVAERPVWC